MTHHILLYTDDPGIGGVAQYNHTILLGLAEQGYRVTCVQTLSDNPLVAEQTQHGIQHEWLYFHTGKEFGRTFSNPADAQEILAKTKPDLIIFSDACPISNFAAKEVAKELGIPFVVVVGFVAPYLAERLGEMGRAKASITLQQQYEYARAVIAVSQENLGLLHQLFGLPPNKGQVIHYGRPEAYFTPRDAEIRDRLRQEVGIPADAVVCFTAARLEAIKGFQYQLDAIVQLKDSPFWDDLYFVWAGDGALSDWLREAIAAENMGDRVKLLGQRWDIADWHNAADIFVLPSGLEGMPLAIMEAMAKGNPVIATAVSGIPEELGDTGKLLPNPADDPQGVIDGLSETIAEWANDAALRQAIGQACQQRAAVMFKVQRMVNETLALIQSALEPVPQTTPSSSSSSVPQPPAVPAPVSVTAPASATIAFPQGDYVSAGLALVKPDSAFPHKIVGDTRTCEWPYLRREIPHNWYVDERWPMVGFLSRDEAHILYNSALQFSGQRALEIGCWMGWSACHLALAGVQLDVVDPLLERPEFYQSVSGSLRAAGVLDHVNLAPGYSPQKVDELAARDQRKWSLLFIDGNHEAPAPLQDAIACEPYAEADAMILFHDLSSPDVAQGLDYLRQRGWNTLIYQTMQIMGVAWRGNVQPVYHEPDPAVAWQLPSHLAYYSVSGIHYRPALGTAARPLPPVVSPVASPVISPVEQPLMPPAEGSPQATPEQVNALLQQAIALFNERKLLDSLHVAEEAVALGIAVPNLHYVRAMTLCHLGRHKEGLAAAKAELAINPAHGLVQEMIDDLERGSMQSNVSTLPTLERPWHTILPPEILKPLQRATFRYTYRGVSLLKNPFDLALYPMLLWAVKPRTIIEIGSKDGGSAMWMGDMLNTFGLDGHVYSVDIVKVSGIQHPRVTYLEGNGRDLGQTFSPEFLRQLPRPLLVIEDADHEYETSKQVLEFFHPHLQQDEYIVIEDGILSDLHGDAKGNSGPHRALKEFLAAHSDEYVIDANYCDFFGYNLTWNTNGYLKRVKVLATPAVAAQAPATQAIAPSDTLISQLLSGVEQIGGPGGSLGSRPLDRELLPQALRAGKEQMAQGAIQSAIATYQTVLAMNPGSVTAHHALSSAYWQQNAVQKSLEHHLWANHAHTWLGSSDTAEFQEIVAAIQPYTLLSLERLLSLYRLTKQMCLDDVPGNIVECGTYKGGSAALMAAVIKRYSLRPRRLYACDTFEGMPDPIEVDKHEGIPANLTGFGAGTLQAPIEENLRVVCQALGVEDIVVPLKGLFAETLPANKAAIGEIALLHADGDWYESTMDIFNILYDQVVPDGLIQIDDYGFWEGCKRAIHDFERQRHTVFPLRVIDFTGVWFRRELGIDPDSNHWLSIWQVAQMAEKLGNTELADRAAQAVLKIKPSLIRAEAMLARLRSQPETVASAQSSPTAPPQEPSPPRVSAPAIPPAAAVADTAAANESEVENTAESTAEASQGDTLETAPEPICEALESAGIESIAQLEALIAEYQQAIASPLAIGQLRRLRQYVGEYWLSSLGDELDSLYDGTLGTVHRLLITSGLRNEALTQAEHTVRDDTVGYLHDGLAAPGAVQHLLAAMLYCYPHQLPFEFDLTIIPPAALEDYFSFMVTPPTVFQQLGEVDRYANYMTQWIAYLHGQILSQPESPFWQSVAIAFLNQANFIPLYFTSRNLKAVMSQRGDILEFAIRSLGYEVDYTLPERGGDRPKIRIGIISDRFTPQTETFFTLPVFEHLDRDKFEIYLYTIEVQGHPLERYCLSRVDKLVQLPEELASRIHTLRSDDLDILLLANNVSAVTNYTAQTALHRVARIQITHFGSPITTGIANVDYFLSGTLSEPKEAEQHYREQLITLEGTGFCFNFEAAAELPQIKPSREGLGIPAWASTVFMSGASIHKITPELRETWAKILAAVPKSVLVLYPFAKSWGDTPPTRLFQSSFQTALGHHGVDENRLILVPALPSRADVKECLKCGDVYLDSYPHSGANSLLDPLEVGLPAVVWQGQSLRANHGAGMMRDVGLADLVASDEDSYIKLAIALGTDRKQRQRWGDRTQRAMQTTPAFLDSQHYASLVGPTFERLFADYQAGELRQQLHLRSINRIAFPDWNQPEETLFGELVDLIRGVVTDPDRDQTTLLLSTGSLDEAEADLALSSVLMHLLTEESIEVSDTGPEITLISPNAGIPWPTLMGLLSDRLDLPHNDQQAIAQTHADRLPIGTIGAAREA